MAPASKANYKSYEAQARLVRAIVAAHPEVKWNYKGKIMILSFIIAPVCSLITVTLSFRCLPSPSRPCRLVSSYGSKIDHPGDL